MAGNIRRGKREYRLGRRNLTWVAAVTLAIAAWSSPPNAQQDFLGAGWDNASALAADVAANPGSMYAITQRVTRADVFWDAGYTGDDVAIALIDTGVVDLDGIENEKDGPDLSLDQQFSDLEHLDAFGHGTHLAGIAVGRDGDPDDADQRQDRFFGMAPGSEIIDVKVGDRFGRVDVSQVIHAIDWVIEKRNKHDIGVLLLAYGTDGAQSPATDPLADAVERAWEAGIVVVVAAGNDGNAAPLRNPASDPFVIAVGATDSAGTYSTADDTVSAFSACGTAVRGPDLVAPGQSVISLRVPGSVADSMHPEARVGERFFVGSGTSQAAAVVAGAAALVLEQRPDIEPDQVKALLTGTAQPIPGATRQCQGDGLLDLAAALEAPTPDGAGQTFDPSSGAGSLEAARGSHHVSLLGLTLTGETGIEAWMPFVAWMVISDVIDGEDEIDEDLVEKIQDELEDELEDHFDDDFDDGTVEKLVAHLTSWGGNSWGGNSWGGNSWGGNSWGGNSWGGNSWGGNSWGGNSWGSNSWS